MSHRCGAWMWESKLHVSIGIVASMHSLNPLKHVENISRVRMELISRSNNGHALCERLFSNISSAMTLRLWHNVTNEVAEAASCTSSERNCNFSFDANWRTFGVRPVVFYLFIYLSIKQHLAHALNVFLFIDLFLLTRDGWSNKTCTQFIAFKFGTKNQLTALYIKINNRPELSSYNK